MWKKQNSEARSWNTIMDGITKLNLAATREHKRRGEKTSGGRRVN